MEKKRCLYCYQKLEADAASEYHAACSKAFYGSTTPPILSIDEKDFEEMAREIVKLSITIPGVQAKLSLALQKDSDDPKKSRLTVVGLWGNYILKPQANGFTHLPENEDLTMKLSERAAIRTAEHCLIRTSNGSLAYITKRFDRTAHGKIPTEDLCQLSELPSSGNNKYNSTMEKAGKVIARNSSTPGLDVQLYFELTLFAFLTGNADMHLKNFSIIKSSDNQYRLAPAYDLLCTALAMPDDQEQMAMHLNGKKNNIRKKGFLEFAATLKIDASVAEKIIARQLSFEKDFHQLVSISFLPDDYKKQYSELIQSRILVMRG